MTISDAGLASHLAIKGLGVDSILHCMPHQRNMIFQLVARKVQSNLAVQVKLSFGNNIVSFKDDQEFDNKTYSQLRS